MRRALMGISISIGALASAAATDLPPRTKAPPPVTPYNWSGYYLGGNIGYGWGASDTSAPFYDPGGVLPGVPFATVATRFNLNGVIGGGQIGYNWQTGRWVFGIEADLQATDQSGQATGQSGNTNLRCRNGICSFAPGVLGAPVTDVVSQRLRWLDTLRGRVGVTVTPSVLAYLTAGLAYGGVSTDATVSGVNGTTPVIGSFSSGATRTGWTIGVGIESAISGRWTGKIEYLYADLGTVSGGPFVSPIAAPSGAFLTSGLSSHVSDNIFRVGVNYRF